MEIKGLEKLAPLLAGKGTGQSLYEFYKAVNEVFHDVEAKYYDQLHQNMWRSLQPIYQKLAKKAQQHSPLPHQGLRLLDIGCGTGLGTQLLLATDLGKAVEKICLLDSSAEMLNQSKQKAAQWGKQATFVHGYLDAVAGQQFDLIICSSVMHHIPDLEAFCAQVSALQAPGGVYIHLQDPNAHSVESPVYKQRQQQYEAAHNSSVGNWRIQLYKIKRSIQKLFTKDYLDEVNDLLLAKGHIRKPLRPTEIWGVTDIRVEGNEYGASAGLSLDEVGRYLHHYELIGEQSYAFFGPLWYDLPQSLQGEELHLQANGDKNGRNIGAAWLKK